MNGRLLVIDDNEAACRLVKAVFKGEGLEVLAAFDGQSGLDQANSTKPDVVLLDVQLPRLDGLQVLERLKTADPTLPVVMLTGSRDVKTAVRATRLGAFDYLTKPFDREELIHVVGRALEARSLRREVAELRRHVGETKKGDLASQMGASQQIRHVIEQVGVVAASNFTVLILGETGAGKELVAQAIHAVSDRRHKPFAALDCGAIPEALLESELFGHERGAFTGAERRTEGRFRLADGGTCLLDEIGNLPVSLQSKLLRVLESGQVQPVGADRARPMDVRFVAATNDDLRTRVAQGVFRADLYFRLAQYTIALPALRDRVEDIEHLADRFLREASLELRRPMEGILPGALEVLRQHRWPGNVRELRNVVRQAVLQSRALVVDADAIKAAIGSSTEAMPAAAGRQPDQSLRQVADEAARSAERRVISESLQATGGNKSRSARLLKTDYKTLHLKMRALGLHARDFERRP